MRVGRKIDPRIGVVGGSGLAGSTLVARCRAAGYETFATHHRHAPPGDAGPSVALDLRDDTRIDEWVRSTRPDVVVNAAYVPSGDDLESVTGRAPGVLAAATHRAGAAFVQLSSDVVFAGRCQPHDEHPYDENADSDPVHAYGRAKAAAEHAVLAAHPTATLLRTSLLYGGAALHTQERLVQRAAGVGDIAFYTDEVRSPVAVDDLVDAIIGLWDQPGIWHVTGTDAVDRLTFARLLAPQLGIDPAALRGTRLPADAARPAHLVLDCSKAAARGVVARGVYDVLG